VKQNLPKYQHEFRIGQGLATLMEHPSFQLYSLNIERKPYRFDNELEFHTYFMIDFRSSCLFYIMSKVVISNYRHLGVYFQLFTYKTSKLLISYVRIPIPIV